ncbi:MAG: tetratricopeptide repeat protein [Spirochaetaceae bacterium]|jgi:tetratricopeptide (TPR) repeat protein|nr:tetratricopeptide repeat protein [Spirochaetaceae bacterium]
MENENAVLFFQRYRKVILGMTLVVAAVVLGMVAFLSVQDIVTKKAIKDIEELAVRYNELKPSFNGENAEKMGDVDKLLTDLAAFAEKTGRYSGSRAWSMAGDIYAEKKVWLDAENAYINSAHTGKKTYLAPVSLYNAAVCAEEQGKNEEAREYWVKSLAYADFPLAARAQFSIGRLWEKTGNVDEALAAYRLLVETYTKEAEWANLAQSRIIALETGMPAIVPAAAPAPETEAASPAAATSEAASPAPTEALE